MYVLAISHGPNRSFQVSRRHLARFATGGDLADGAQAVALRITAELILRRVLEDVEAPGDVRSIGI